MKLGDAIEKIAHPIAQTLNLPCHDEQGQLRPESGCGKRKQTANNFGDAIYDFFWPSTTQTKKE